ncbi:Sec-independent protein translocase subunit TatA [Lysobacter sp. D1-1-M9]|uniref:Sec-independent protein translocase subunit TatA n=1 Tax=Novilysobacter longmucuonensis TaxID=3098603 RepID=UPI002FC67417
MGSLSIWHWLVVLVVVVLVFGTKRLKNVGQDLGEAVRGFKKGVKDDDGPDAQLRDESRSADVPRSDAPKQDADTPPRHDDRTPR